MGVVPAWSAWPRKTMRERRTPTIASTTPICTPDSSSRGPCSMCSSTYAATEPAGAFASGARWASKPARAIELAAECARPEQAAVAALLVGPGRDGEGALVRRLRLGEDFEAFEAGDDAERAIEHAAFGHRIDVGSSQNGRAVTR